MANKLYIPFLNKTLMIKTLCLHSYDFKETGNEVLEVFLNLGMEVNEIIKQTENEHNTKLLPHLIYLDSVNFNKLGINLNLCCKSNTKNEYIYLMFNKNGFIETTFKSPLEKYLLRYMHSISITMKNYSLENYEVSSSIVNLFLNKDKIEFADLNEVVLNFNKILEYPDHHDGSAWYEFKMKMDHIFSNFGYNIIWTKNDECISFISKMRAFNYEDTLYFNGDFNL